MPNCAFNFPAEIPWGCGTDLFASYKAGTLLTNKSTSTQTAAQALGQVGAMMKDAPVAFGAADVPQDLDTCIARLERARDPSIMMANPLLLAIFMKALQLLIDKLLKS